LQIRGHLLGHKFEKKREDLVIGEMEIARQGVGNVVEDARYPLRGQDRLGLDHKLGVLASGLEVILLVVAEVGAVEPTGGSGGIRLGEDA